MGALLDDQAVVQDVDAVGVADAGQAVGDEEDGPVVGVLADGPASSSLTIHLCRWTGSSDNIVV
uniref:hypothetical protein n=1 Tax=Herbidospora sakaeratensis TaxID=564415 RepID=UPI000784B096|nr:hypothetical protein [Herbidospora sakaeratensis]